MQSRPRALRRLLSCPDRNIGEAMRWYYRIGRKVWFHEITQFIRHDRRVKPEKSLLAYWGPRPVAEEMVLLPVKAVERSAPAKRQSKIGNMHLKTGT